MNASKDPSQASNSSFTIKNDRNIISNTYVDSLCQRFTPGLSRPIVCNDRVSGGLDSEYDGFVVQGYYLQSMSLRDKNPRCT